MFDQTYPTVSRIFCEILQFVDAPSDVFLCLKGDQHDHQIAICSRLGFLTEAMTIPRDSYGGFQQSHRLCIGHLVLGRSVLLSFARRNEMLPHYVENDL